MRRILLIEDDPKITSFIRIGLEGNDYIVDNAYDGLQGERLAYSRKYDIIVLDIMIPGISGLDLCRKIRNNGNLTPVIMLTSLNSVPDIVAGFDCGADDYLTKPFNFDELLARLKSLVRRNSEVKVAPVIRVHDLELDSVAKKVRRNNKEITLTSTEFKILEVFLSNKNKVLSRISISEKIWGSSFSSGTNVIDVHVNSLRNKIDKDYEHKLLHTKKGFGYVLVDEK